MRIAIIHGNDGSDVRVGKLCRLLSRNGFDVHFIGWDRRPDEAKAIDLGEAQSYLLGRETKLGRASILGQLQFSMHIYRCLRLLKPNVVSCVNEDTAISVSALKPFLFDHLICEIFDSLVDRHSHRGWVTKQLLQLVSRLSRWNSDRLIITDSTRLARIERHVEKCVVIENFPEDPGEDVACTKVTGPTKIFVAGTLHEGRGLRQILAAVDSTEDCTIVCAGWIYDDFAKNEFLTHPKVEYRGILTAKSSLFEAASCDAIFAFYKPSTVNNIFASPNKVYDAMSVGRPIVINNETNIADWIIKEDLGYTCGYADVEGLTDVVKAISQNRGRLAEFTPRVRGMFVGTYSWESIESKIVRAYTCFS